MRGIYRGPVNSPHKWPVTRKIFPFDDVIMAFSSPNLDTNECASDPCQNGATCTDGLNLFTCNCATGWYGTTCDTSKWEWLSTHYLITRTPPDRHRLDTNPTRNLWDSKKMSQCGKPKAHKPCNYGYPQLIMDINNQLWISIMIGFMRFWLSIS